MKDDDNWYVRRPVAMRIEDQDRLWEMRNDSISYVRQWVAWRIKDRSRLLIMKDAETDSIAIRVINKRLVDMACSIEEDTV